MPDAPIARYYEKGKGDVLRCSLCPHRCSIGDGHSGVCGARSNRGGVLHAETYGRVTSMAMDPMEKKPLYHFFPGSRILSIGAGGCNLQCPFCQNWRISRDAGATSDYYSPEEIVAIALRQGSTGIAYTYNEPMIWAEYVIDTSRIAAKNGLSNVMVSNGYVNPEPLGDLLHSIDAFNIDLKSISESTYSNILKGGLSPVQRTIEAVHGAGKHLEVTTLIVTGLNDTMDEMDSLIAYLASIDRKIPWHISRYYPNYRYAEKETSLDFLFRVHEHALRSLDFVYCGNVVSGSPGSDTRCPECGSVVIRRRGYALSLEGLAGSRCARCGAEMNIRR
jgi:pyruvate formate lyase activating enzyme